MEELMGIIKSDVFLLTMIGIIILLFLGFIILIVKYSKLSKKYQNFMKKLGNGNNIEEDLKTYMNKVEEIKKQNEEVITYITRLNKDVSKCIQKVGIVRYSAFKDTGSDLSFALALLDENNDGVVLNGIYSREMSNIYAKPVNNGKSTYTISAEEQQAIQKAIGSNDIYRIN